MKLCVDCIHVGICYRQGTVDLNYAEKCGDYEPNRRKGKWIINPKGIYAHLVCNKCLSNAPYDIGTKFCPICGAEMESEE